MQTLTFALDASKILRHVDEVANGLACGCTCPGCGEQLVAKQGQKTMHHFAHASGSDCATGLQTALHLAAKEILVREMRMRLPELRERVEVENQHGQFGADASISAKNVRFDSVDEEVWLDGIIPDIVAKVGGKTLLVEIVVTHFADADKIAKIKARNLAAVEVDLSDLKKSWDWVELRAAVIDGKAEAKWLHNPRSAQLREEAQREIQRRIAAEIEETRSVNAKADGLFEAKRVRGAARIAAVRASPEFSNAIKQLNEFDAQAVQRADIDVYWLLGVHHYRSVMTQSEKDLFDRLETAVKVAVINMSLYLTPDERFNLQKRLYCA